MTKQEKQNTTRIILRQIDNAYREMGEFLGKLKKTDKVEIFIRNTCMVYPGYLHRYIDDGEESDTLFSLKTKCGLTIDFCVWDLILDRTHYDLRNNILTLVVEDMKVE